MSRFRLICASILTAAIAGCAVAPVAVEAQANRIDIDSYRLLGDLALARQQREAAAR